MAESSPTARRLPRFTVRGMIFGVLFLAVVLGWISSVRRVGWVQRMQHQRFLYLDEELRRARQELRDQERGVEPDRSRSFWHADLEGSDLTGMTIASPSNAFQRASFRDCRLRDATLEGGDSSFQFARFDGAKLARARLKGGHASFQLSTFVGADLTDAILTGGGASFQSASFEDANLTGATLSGDFQAANINGAKFEAADLTAIVADDLANCVFKDPPTYSAATRFPAGFDPVQRMWRRVE